MPARTDARTAASIAGAAVAGLAPGSAVEGCRLFELPGCAGGDPHWVAAGAREVSSAAAMARHACQGGAFAVCLVASCPLRVRCPRREADVAPEARASERFDRSIVGGSVLRVLGGDPEIPALLRCSVPIVVAGSRLTGSAQEKWGFEYLERHMGDVDNFFVLRAPSSSKGRFGYYDMDPAKNPCGYTVRRTNERVEMRFPAFRREAVHAQSERAAGREASSLYLQSALLHREPGEDGPPRPVGSFGRSCARQVARDIEEFGWDWLRWAMGGRHAQICQLFCGLEGGFSPCHYDPQDNMFAQVRGVKRVLLFHPRHAASLYPWPVHHPQDRQSQVEFGHPDRERFPGVDALRGQGLEAVIGPGDVLHIPPGWWHHVEMVDSPPNGEAVSINFWYPAPLWYHGDLSAADGVGGLLWDRPLFGVRRLLYMRCVEELIAKLAGPQNIPAVLRLALSGGCGGDAGQSFVAALESIATFTSTVFPEPVERRELLRQILDGRFQAVR